MLLNKKYKKQLPEQKLWMQIGNDLRNLNRSRLLDTATDSCVIVFNESIFYYWRYDRWMLLMKTSIVLGSNYTKTIR